MNSASAAHKVLKKTLLGFGLDCIIISVRFDETILEQKSYYNIMNKLVLGVLRIAQFRCDELGDRFAQKFLASDQYDESTCPSCRQGMLHS
jgi:hypothetical protein